MATPERNPLLVEVPAVHPSSPGDTGSLEVTSFDHEAPKASRSGVQQQTAETTDTQQLSSRCASTETRETEGSPAVRAAATPQERAAALELEAAAMEIASKWPRPGPLAFHVEAEHGRARAGLLCLPHGNVETPVFMPVGTNGAIKGIHLGLLQCIDRERTASTVEGAPSPDTGVASAAERTNDSVPSKKKGKGQDLPQPPTWFSRLILGNTFHLYRQVGGRRMREVGKGLHRFMRWGANLLTDSGGFQMVSLCRLMDVYEEGVCFRLGKHGLSKKFFPAKRKQARQQQQQRNANTETADTETAEPRVDTDSDEVVLLTPEESVAMQVSCRFKEHLMDGCGLIEFIVVVSFYLLSVCPLEPCDFSLIYGASAESDRQWLDRCIVAHGAPGRQALFGIVQGGLDLKLRERALQLFKKRRCHGCAIGGLSGGERKADFWRVVDVCTREDKGLPKRKPRYLMGVGYALDLVVCVALGCDMFDCVFPCRTARFGTAMTRWGSIRIKQHKYALDLRPLDPECDCYTCRSYSRAFLHSTFNRVSHLDSFHLLRSGADVTKACSSRINGLWKLRAGRNRKILSPGYFFGAWTFRVRLPSYSCSLQSPMVGQLLTLHNLFYLKHLCSEMRQSIKEHRFHEFVCGFLERLYPRQTIMADGGMSGTQPPLKRRRLSLSAAQLQDARTSTPVAPDHDAGAALRASTNNGICCSVFEGTRDILDTGLKPRPPQWVREALLTAGIDIGHLYFAFDESE
ncbi:queuine tRNA-ribosyltransferase domain-containing protein [Cyclospora cayetanensis]|uniref:Queuine tRNA-ribosyltransferase domain-containing protein n=1 Tax=Cyclospora cayetanensis TaxID=88456 RepID=A0A1D3D3F0_9EIME|nr:queuine tRNA-ribosyltransferase domain-containing protein [Cyclospora cayetanensis]